MYGERGLPGHFPHPLVLQVPLWLSITLRAAARKRVEAQAERIATVRGLAGGSVVWK